MEVLLLGTGELLERVAAQLAAGDLEVVRLEGAEDAAQHVGEGRVVVVVVEDTPEGVAPLNLLPPATRRRLVVVQVGDKLTTGDGSTAFVRAVNLVVAGGDVERLPDLMERAVTRHRELVGLLEPELRP